MDLNFADKRATDLFASRNSVYAVTHRDKDFNFARVNSRSFRPNQELLYHRQDTINAFIQGGAGSCGPWFG